LRSSCVFASMAVASLGPILADVRLALVSNEAGGGMIGSMTEPANVDEYLATLAEDRRGPMKALREAIRAAAPDATEVITYKMPGFKSHGQFLVSYDAFKNHYSLFPASDAVVVGLGEALTPYLAGKGTIRFPASRPIPLDLVRRIVEIRVAENEAEHDHDAHRD
jgi:uncharacterized protein YdhG (YjbR/CyaY superfamily)